MIEPKNQESTIPPAPQRSAAQWLLELLLRTKKDGTQKYSQEDIKRFADDPEVSPRKAAARELLNIQRSGKIVVMELVGRGDVLAKVTDTPPIAPPPPTREQFLDDAMAAAGVIMDELRKYSPPQGSPGHIPKPAHGRTGEAPVTRQQCLTALSRELARVKNELDVRICRPLPRTLEENRAIASLNDANTVMQYRQQELLRHGEWEQPPTVTKTRDSKTVSPAGPTPPQ